MRTRVEVREDPQELAASCLSHSRILRRAAATVVQVAQAPPPLCCSPSPLWPAAPRRHWWCGWRPRHRHPGTCPSRTGSCSSLDSTLAGAGGAEDRCEASTRYPAPPSPRLYCFFWTTFAEEILHGMVDMRCLQLRWTTSSSNSPWIWRQGAEELQLPKAVAKGWSIRPCSQDLCSAFDFPI